MLVTFPYNASDIRSMYKIGVTQIKNSNDVEVNFLSIMKSFNLLNAEAQC